MSQAKQNKKTPDPLGHKSFGEIVLSGSQLIQIFLPSELFVKSFDLVVAEMGTTALKRWMHLWMQAQKHKHPVQLFLFAKTTSYIVIVYFIVKNLCWEMFSVLQYHTSRQYGKILFYDMQKSPTEKNENDILKYISIALWWIKFET